MAGPAKLLNPAYLKQFSKPSNRTWHLFDATNQRVGRLANYIAPLVMGKHKASYIRGIDNGDTVVVVNVEKLVFTGKKRKFKLYRKHSGYPGGLKELTAEQVFERDPARILESAVSGMLPKDLLQRRRLSRVKCYRGPDHPHQQQFGNTKVSLTTNESDGTPDHVLSDDAPEHIRKVYEYWTSKGDDGLRKL
mmetsp:Transcript_22144/g.43989  ORF Transcript_22144/g.43989 Transcript_22144/m.43989 type:complete len:192 (+) Transcript_22144:50-625(+)|eukprot:CAMPEP_0175143606 /NCGR_PEP_ID=MMETSP0087-20121206/13556_1 /TAXON_ID=136419 /ORGANISM="Unknown Unknown, Strain D1" /LENGTH=191 /DNA_ID=CAMNT_0016427755 /DNA_START=62 /DNA_END=637 /DNA_ORIENTATION=-